MRLFITKIILAAAFILTALTLAAGTTDAFNGDAVYGYVKTPTGAGINGIAVYWTNPSGDAWWDPTCNGGKFRFGEWGTSDSDGPGGCASVQVIGEGLYTYSKDLRCGRCILCLRGSGYTGKTGSNGCCSQNHCNDSPAFEFSGQTHTFRLINVTGAVTLKPAGYGNANGSTLTATFNGAPWWSSDLTIGTFILNPPPPSPPQLSEDQPSICVKNGGGPRIYIKWTPSTNTWTYDVYRNGGTTPYKTNQASPFTDSSVVSGVTYSYYIVANGPGGKTQSNTIEETAATCDTTPPTVSISSFPPPGKICFKSADLTTYPAAAFAQDNPGGSGVASVNFYVNDLTAKRTSSALGALFNSSGTYNGLWTASLTLASPHLILNRYYNVTAKATDNAGNVSTLSAPSAEFVYATDCTTPYLQTTGGDVHSNKGINTPGGP